MCAAGSWKRTSPGVSRPKSASSRTRPSRYWSTAWVTTPPDHPVQRPADADLRASAVGERSVVEVGLGQDLAFLLVLHHVRPRLAIALLEQDVLGAHDVAGVEVLRVGPRPHLHARVLGPQRRD